MARPRSDIRDRIVHAAREHFLRDGVDGASLRGVATQAKTSIGMVYYYFKTKDELFLAVLEDVYAAVLRDLMEALDPLQSVEDRIRGLYRRIGSMSNEEMTVIRLIVREALVSSERVDQVLERFRRGHLPLMLRLIADATTSGTVDPSIPPVVLLVSMMALGGAGQLLRRFIEARMPFPPQPDAVSSWDRMLGIFLHGVSAKAPPGGPS